MQLGNYICKEINGFFLCKSSMLYQFKKLFHVVTTRKVRINGCSEELDFSLRNENSLKQFEYFLRFIGVEKKDVIFAEQVHGNRIECVKRRNLKDELNVIKGVDGLVTNEKGVFLITRFADCIPIIAYDSKRNVVGVAHSGWKGTLFEISKQLILKMNGEYGCFPEDIFVSLGPSIGPQSFEVKEDVLKMFYEKFGDGYIRRTNELTYINLWKIVEDQLSEVGVRNIEISMVDTVSFNDYFYSYRKEKKFKRFAVIVGLL
ncbi:polyphenol oxidoreductase [Thermosipho melanesiensis]|uniref:Purine nucleoside phosphorylase n=2 Tax=Thermosipho melanesiensis TaxID=46541 RepID=A6LNI6_THEM4|nr:peptidoglycan editing factor PgeF [Thermosipho melanesiensis]ABR31487.1 protein of unknown function DUF152 [Thermosipho melanesiensis BI429]APT74544.1 polyphenol oxidoreductase [Thermosipho melanesiensis]OOC36494.1 polyphenol oxidoreductase [Thermosipho melanesiensis]OOC37312.1 polyphenol oxidoreductase [Thermosipho melanesiensis]OOC38065.1 polyphenol oxidoreductase [Thermosipho melanesiensis]